MKLAGDFGQWLDENRAELQAKAEAEISAWMKSEMPNYLAACGGDPSKEGFIAYTMEKLSNAADPELNDRFLKAGIFSILAQSDPADPHSATMMTSAEMLQRLAEGENKSRGEMSTIATPLCPPNEKINKNN
jgi:hypothetical protein